MTKAVVVDLSHWDPSDDYPALKASGIVGVIAQATRNPTYPRCRYGDPAGEDR
jgi:hypothetical protein